MIWHIVAREFLDSLESRRFIISAILCVFLIAFTVYVSTDDYVDRLKDHNSAITAHEKDPNQMPEMGYEIYRNPRVLGVFSEGVDKHVGNVVDITPWESPFRARGYGWQSRETEYMASFASIDVAFTIKFILSLLAIFLTYDAISGERESGLLRLVLSNSLSRGTFLMGKLVGRLLCLLIPLIMGMIVGLLFLLFDSSIQLTRTDWPRIAIFFGTALLYTSVFLCLGLAVSAAVRSSASSLIILLTLWVLAIAIHPVLSVIATEYFRPIDEPGTMAKKVRSVEEEYRKRLNELNEILMQLEREGKWEERLKYSMQYLEIDREKGRAADRIKQDFLNEFTAQADFARNLSRLSPAGCFSNAAEAIVSTDIGAYDGFMNQCRLFWHQFVDWRDDLQEYRAKLQEKSREEARKMKPPETPEKPEIEYTLAESVQRAAPDIAILVLLAGLCFIAVYALFARREI